jgi:hypothetical protein
MASLDEKFKNHWIVRRIPFLDTASMPEDSFYLPLIHGIMSNDHTFVTGKLKELYR